MFSVLGALSAVYPRTRPRTSPSLSYINTYLSVNKHTEHGNLPPLFKSPGPQSLKRPKPRRVPLTYFEVVSPNQPRDGLRSSCTSKPFRVYAPPVGLAGRDKSDGLSRAEIRCGFHAIQAEAKRRQEAAARRKRNEALRKEARVREARKAEEARCEERLCRCTHKDYA